MNLDAPDQVIGVHIGNPMLALRPEFAPPGNNVAFMLLHRMLELALLRDGLTREDCCGGCGAEFNDCVFMAAVTDVIAAADTIKRELATLSILPHCQIGVLEDAGWQCLYPSPDVRLKWLMDDERLEFAGVKFLLAVDAQQKAIREAMKLIQQEDGRQGDKQ
jgi:hypothetical protein